MPVWSIIAGSSISYGLAGCFPCNFRSTKLIARGLEHRGGEHCSGANPRSIEHCGMAAVGASRPLRRVPAIVSFLNPQPTLSLGRGNWSSCPKAVEPVAPRRLLFRNGPHLRKTLHTTS